MNRRQFVQTVAASLVIAPALAAENTSPAPMPVRTLGRAGIQVPIIGFGSGSRFLMYKEDDKAMKLLAYALSLPVSLASLGMSRLEHIERNAAFARAFTPVTEKERRGISESIEKAKKLSMLNFFQNHRDV